MTRADQVNQAIEEIRAFYELGRRAPKEAKAGARQGLIKKAAEREMVHPDILRKARQFYCMYNEEAKLKALLDTVSAKQSQQATSVSVFGMSHVLRLVTIRDCRQRRSLLLRALREAWSTAQMDQEISKLFGTRWVAGRKPRIPADQLGCFVALEQMCERWRRWVAELSRDTAKDGEHVRLQDFAKDVRERIGIATEAVVQLQRALVGELKQRRPGFQSRPHLEAKRTASKRARSGSGKTKTKATKPRPKKAGDEPQSILDMWGGLGG